MPIITPLAPQSEQFIHDNPQGALTSFRRNGIPQMSIVTVYPRDGGVGISITDAGSSSRTCYATRAAPSSSPTPTGGPGF